MPKRTKKYIKSAKISRHYPFKLLLKFKYLTAWMSPLAPGILTGNSPAGVDRDDRILSSIEKLTIKNTIQKSMGLNNLILATRFSGILLQCCAPAASPQVYNSIYLHEGWSGRPRRPVLRHCVCVTMLIQIFTLLKGPARWIWPKLGLFKRPFLKREAQRF